MNLVVIKPRSVARGKWDQRTLWLASVLVVVVVVVPVVLSVGLEVVVEGEEEQEGEEPRVCRLFFSDPHARTSRDLVACSMDRWVVGERESE